MAWRRSRLARFGLIGLAAAGLGGAGGLAAGSSVAQIPGSMRPAPPQEVRETFRDWTIACLVWSAPRRVECEMRTTAATGDVGGAAGMVWLRSSERWLEGVRFRLDDSALDVSRGVRLWVDSSMFSPEFACKPFPLERNTCAVHDIDVNRRLVERLITAQRVSAVGLSPKDGGKAEVRFSLLGFRAALERTEQLGAEAGTPSM